MSKAQFKFEDILNGVSGYGYNYEGLNIMLNDYVADMRLDLMDGESKEIVNELITEAVESDYKILFSHIEYKTGVSESVMLEKTVKYIWERV